MLRPQFTDGSQSHVPNPPHIGCRNAFTGKRLFEVLLEQFRGA